MPENEPKKKPETAKANEKEESGNDDRDGDATWSADQKRRGYYYDDAHGYEIYQPDDGDDDGDDEESEVRAKIPADSSL